MKLKIRKTTEEATKQESVTTFDYDLSEHEPYAAALAKRNELANRLREAEAGLAQAQRDIAEERENIEAAGQDYLRTGDLSDPDHHAVETHRRRVEVIRRASLSHVRDFEAAEGEARAAVIPRLRAEHEAAVNRAVQALRAFNGALASEQAIRGAAAGLGIVSALNGALSRLDPGSETRGESVIAQVIESLKGSGYKI